MNDISPARQRFAESVHRGGLTTASRRCSRDAMGCQGPALLRV